MVAKRRQCPCRIGQTLKEHNDNVRHHHYPGTGGMPSLPLGRLEGKGEEFQSFSAPAV